MLWGSWKYISEGWLRQYLRAGAQDWVTGQFMCDDLIGRRLQLGLLQADSRSRHPLSWNQIFDTVASAAGTKAIKVHVSFSRSCFAKCRASDRRFNSTLL